MTGAGGARAALALLLFPIALLIPTSLASCRSSGGGSGSDHVDLSEGTITYHEPGGRTITRGDRTDKTRLATVTITTEKQEIDPEKGIRGDRIENRATGKSQPTDQEALATRIFRQRGERFERVISPASFREVWGKLVEAGILDLPRHPEEEPPAGQPWIRVQADDRRWIFTHPDLTPSRSSSRGEADGLRRAWTSSIIIITQASN